MVADGQFSTLGTVLLATLARLVKATGTDRDLKNPAQTEKKGSSKPSPPSVQVPQMEDVGEPIRRTEDIPRPIERVETRTSIEPGTHSQDTVKKARSTVDVEAKAPKKKKKKNAIDDLFAGVL